MKRLLYGFITVLAITALPADASNATSSVIYSDPTLFAGWPANEGFWQWGDEMLVGFNVAEFLERSDTHNVAPGSYMWVNFARSLDGGETWTVEQHPEVSTPGVFNSTGDYVKASGYPTIPTSVPSPGGFDFTADGFALKARNTRFWVSDDRGQSWSNPYQLPDFGQDDLSARTNYVVLDSSTMLLFYEAKNNADTYNNTLVVKTSDGGATFQQLGWLAPDTLQGQRPTYSTIMPGVARLDDGTILASTRNTLGDDRWNDVLSSTDNGQTWQKIATPIMDNNNPASLVPLGGQRLALVYGYRNAPFGLRSKISEDGGHTWSPEYILRNDAREWDLGYVRAGLRSDGQVVTAYYYTTDNQPANFIASTIWDSPTGGFPSGGQARYKFDELNGAAVLYDSIGSNDGNMTDVSFVTSGAGVPSSDGRGNAAQFNGTSSVINFGSDVPAFNFGSNDFTITGWLKAPQNTATGSSLANRVVFAATDNIDASTGWIFEIGRADRSYAGQISFAVGGGGTDTTRVRFTDFRVDDDQWHWVAVTVEDGVMKIYVDGQLGSTPSLTIGDGTNIYGPGTNATPPSGVEVKFGQKADSSQARYQGLLDDWRVYDVALNGTLDASNMIIGGELYDVWTWTMLNPEPGDANGDGLVNLSDLQILGDNWQSTTASWATGDFTGDGQVNLADLQILGDRWGYGVGPDLTFDQALAMTGLDIPEPTINTLFALSASLALCRQRHRYCNNLLTRSRRHGCLRVSFVTG